MKDNLIYIAILFLIICMPACNEQHIGQYPVDDIAPQPVSNVRVENMPGAVTLTYDLPDEEDLLYVMAAYELANGDIKVAKTSAYSNKMYIKGFGKSKKHILKLIAVDTSQNESEPVEVEIEPENAPIYEVSSTIKTEETWGGFKIFWENPLNEEIVVEVLQKDSLSNHFKFLQSFYSSELEAEKSVRGLDSIYATFGVYARDAYYNSTDTIVFSLKPLFEEAIPKDGFKGFTLNSALKQHTAFGGPMSEMWDGITNIRENCYYIMTGSPFMPFFTMDLGVKAKLSRFRVWQRIDFLFALHNPRAFDWYGTNEANLASDNESLDWENNPGWILLDNFESKRPSGGGPGDPVTAEDEAYAKAGEEFDFPFESPAVRYLRFKLKSTWSGSTGLHINELSFWGSIED